MAARNARKEEVLKYIDHEEELTAEQVADAFGLEIHNARMQLQRYWKTRLLKRHVVDKKRCSEEDRNLNR